MAEKVRYAYFNDKFEVLHRNEKDLYPMPLHTHNAIEIYFNLSDIQSALLGSSILPLKANTLLIIPSYCIHQFMRRENDAYNRYILTINTQWLNGITENCPAEQYSYLSNSQCPFIIELSTEQKECLTAILERCLSCNDANFFKKMSYFFDAMDYIHQLASDANIEYEKNIKKRLVGTQKTVTEIIKYINEHLYENIKITDVADHFFLSTDYTAKIFKKHTNTPIGNYITIQRITKAKQLLRSGATVTETQIKTGYSSYEHFFRTFKKSVGVTPKEYRDAHYKQ